MIQPHDGRVKATYVYQVHGEQHEISLPVGAGSAEWRTTEEMRAGVPHHVEAVGQIAKGAK